MLNKNIIDGTIEVASSFAYDGKALVVDNHPMLQALFNSSSFNVLISSIDEDGESLFDNKKIAEVLSSLSADEAGKGKHAEIMADSIPVIHNSLRMTMSFVKSFISPMVREVTSKLEEETGNLYLHSGEEGNINIVDLLHIYRSEDFIEYVSGQKINNSKPINDSAIKDIKHVVSEVKSKENDDMLYLYSTGFTKIDKDIKELISVEGAYHDALINPSDIKNSIWSAGTSSNMGFSQLILSALLADKIVRGGFEEITNNVDDGVLNKIAAWRNYLFYAVFESIKNIQYTYNKSYLTIKLAGKEKWVKKNNWVKWISEENHSKEIYLTYFNNRSYFPKADILGPEEKTRLWDKAFIEVVSEQAKKNIRKRDIEINQKMESFVNRESYRIIENIIKRDIDKELQSEVLIRLKKAIGNNDYIRRRDDMRKWICKIICTVFDSGNLDSFKFIELMDSHLESVEGSTTQEAALIAAIYVLTDNIAEHLKWVKVEDVDPSGF